MRTMQRQRLESRLLQERKRVLESIRVLRTQAAEASAGAAGDLSTHPLHLADQAVGSLEREQAFAAADQRRRYFNSIDEELQRLYREPERYGVCQACGGQIAFERLVVVPHTRYCLRCKVAAEV
jgi:DnaK suppressor protein